MVAVRLSW